MKKIITLAIFFNIAFATVNITENLKSITVKDGDRRVEIKRIQDIRNKLPNEFTRTSRECPPFCIQPMYIDDVKPIGEIELLKHLQTLEEENILLIDARSREWHKRGTIPTVKFNHKKHKRIL